MQIIQVVLDTKLLKAADTAAKRRKVNRSALIRQALQEHLPHTTMISVAHTQSPREHHQAVWEFGKGRA